MGLDGVELVMATEEKFGICIEDAAASRVLTVGDLEALVIKKLAEQDASVCRTQRTFYVLRRNAIRHFGIKRSEFSPEALLDEIVPRQNRRELWDQFCFECFPGANARILHLRLTLTVRNVWLLSFPVFGTASYLIALLAHSPLTAFDALGIGLLGWAALGFALQPRRTCFADSIQSVQQLVSYLANKQAKVQAKALPLVKEEEVYPILSKLISEQLAIPEEKFTRNSRFVKDLGVD